jgi:predicted kinase
MMGIPGAGKSFKAKQLAPLPNIFSTDNYWLNDKGEYIFNFNKLRQAHEWNINCVEMAMRNAHTPLVVDNTNIVSRDRKPYIDLANKYNYTYELVLPESSWFQEIHPRIVDKSFTDADVQVFFEKNSHGVPFETIKNMMNKWTE